MSERFIKDVAFFSGIGKALFLRDRKCVLLIINQNCLQLSHICEIYIFISAQQNLLISYVDSNIKLCFTEYNVVRY